VPTAGGWTRTCRWLYQRACQLTSSGPGAGCTCIWSAHMGTGACREVLVNSSDSRQARAEDRMRER
jgi:hypothetical protein